MPNNSGNTFYDKKLEGLRGLCALTVAYAHIFTFNFFDVKVLSFNDFFSHLHFAHIAVLIFFILSGYVIGITNDRLDFNRCNVIKYLKKRAIRLYPIYLIALVISIAVADSGQFSGGQLLGNFAFLQEFAVKTISTNVVLWSLSYEVVYYILFIAIWGLRRCYSTLLVFLPFLASACVVSFFFVPVITSVLAGWIFWILGLYIAWEVKLPKSQPNPSSKPMLSIFLILFSTYYFESGNFILGVLHCDFKTDLNVNVPDLFFLPVCMLIMCEITNRQIKYMRLLMLIAWLIPMAQIAILLSFKHDILANSAWLYGSAFFILALISIPAKTNIYSFEKLLPLGEVSYAIYVFHFPLAYFLSNFLSLYFSGLSLFITGVCIWIVLCAGISIFAEKIMQPRIKQYFS